ncbi:MAG TPA: allophanate hydrolase [Humisphaera sp.]|jgi:allophanate hydrolase|nr:allophanate hydrolase [Humisphaera sp.]
MSRLAPTDSLDHQNLRSHYQSGDWTPQDVAAEILRRIKARGEDGVWISLLPEADLMTSAANAARRLAAGDRGALVGVPFAVKDNIDVAGQLTTAACPDFARLASESSTVVTKLLEAGAILVGKTNMDQFATGLVGTRSPYGTPRNPFDERYIPGGSSSGSAVAVSAGLVSFALGTDTAGSGRVPAAYNNIVGLKATRGRLSTSGVLPACRSLDCVSIFALDCADAAEVMNVVAGFDAADEYSRRPQEIPQRLSQFPAAFRFGVPAKSQLRFHGNQNYEKLFAAAVANLQAIGGQPIEIDYEPFAQVGALLYQGPWVAERYVAVKQVYEQRPEILLPVIRQIISGATKIDGAAAFSGMHQLQRLCRQAENEWAKMDVLLVPTAPTTYTRAQIEADPIKLNLNLGYYTNFVNLMDLSAVAIPAGFGDDKLPTGVTLIAPAGNDAALLSLGDALHRQSGTTMGATGIALPAAVEIPVATTDSVKLAVVGAHLSGQPLNHQLTNLRARLIRTCRTAPNYLLYAIPGTTPPKPGLIRADAGEGGAVEVEVWEMTSRAFGDFVAAIPPPLGIGTLTLEDGQQVKGFLCEPFAVRNAANITHFGGWRAFLKSR